MPSCLHICVNRLRLALAIACIALVAARASAQDPPKYVAPSVFGFDVPPGTVSPGEDQRVATVDDDGRPVVGKVHVNIGDHRIVMLPDGRLVARTAEDAPPTDRRFIPASRDELAEKLSTAFPGFKTEKTHHYVYVYNTSENFALATSRILESMFPGMMAHARSQRITVHEPEVPLVAILFRSQREMQAHRRMPAGVVAYYHTVTNEIVICEESRLADVKPELAIQQAIATIAHEGAHQILHNIGVQARLSIWPIWLGEGLAEYYAPTTFGQRLRWKGAGHVNDLRMFELELYLKGREADQPDGKMVEDTVHAARLTSTGYASAWALTHYLARMHRGDFYDYIREVSRLGPLEVAGDVQPAGVIPANMQLFKKHFGDDLESVEHRLVRHLKSLPYQDPFADWPHYVATITVPDTRRPRREANLFHSPELARKWIQETLETVNDQQRSAARSEVHPFPNRVLAERYARQWLGRGG